MASLLNYTTPPVISLRRNANLGSNNNPNPNPNPNSCSSSSCCHAFSWAFSNCFGVNDIWKRQSLRAHAMSAAQTHGSFISPTGANGVKDEEPDHLLVLVHGIYASPSDWRYVESELKRRLGRHFLIYASSCNTYSKTFAGIDGAGKRLADEVSIKSLSGAYCIMYFVGYAFKNK
ncbi:hypothetical protein Hanom_Chr11g01036121 [Helianthus anomalus]